MVHSRALWVVVVGMVCVTALGCEKRRRDDDSHPPVLQQPNLPQQPYPAQQAPQYPQPQMPQARLGLR